MQKITVFNNVKFDINDDLIFTSEEDGTPMVTDSEGTFKLRFYHKKINSLMLALADKNSMRNSLASDFANGNPTFKRGINYKLKVANRTAFGLSYSFKADDVTKNGDSVFITKRGNYYVFSFSCDEEAYGARKEVFLDILESISL